MIQIQNLCKRFGNFCAVNNLSLHIKKGEVFALLGLNGAGKSTTIGILCGLIEKTSGTVLIDNKNLDTQLEAIKKSVNLSPQETAIAPNLTVFENLELIATLYGQKSQEKIFDTIKQFSLQEKTNVLAKKLSGGQKRRLSVAMAIITNPKILILDEPTLGLDIKARKKLWEIIKTLAQTTTIILTTHYLEEAEALANRIGVMANGKLVGEGTRTELIARTKTQNFEDAFLKLTEESDE
ncbi:MAG: ABC transporter ATP-binding protein [Clostridia bacterium]|nr:ABC transporter ATP-binding protein [Clostridia bacterium]